MGVRIVRAFFGSGAGHLRSGLDLEYPRRSGTCLNGHQPRMVE